ncbi:hypothetical protein [Chroococcidiopsis sp.]
MTTSYTLSRLPCTGGFSQEFDTQSQKIGVKTRPDDSQLPIREILN